MARLLPRFRTHVLLCVAAASLGAAATTTRLSAATPGASAIAPRLLDDVVVTATRVAEPASDLPYVARAIGSETLQATAPRTLPEALREQSSIMVQKTSLGQGSPFIRGFTGFRTVLLVDGFRLNNAVFRDGPNQYWNTVDSWSVERLELVKGPASAQYGSDAVGGVVQASTLAPHFSGTQPQLFARTAYRYAAAERSHVGRVEAGAGVGPATAFVLGGTLKTFGDLHGGRDTGVQPKTGYDEYAFDFKLEHRFSPATRLTLAHQTVDQDDVWRTHATIYGLRWEGTRPGSNLARYLDQRRQLTYARLEADTAGALRDVHIGVAWHRQTEEEYRQRGNLRIERAGFDVDTLATFAHARWDSPVGRWVAGVEFNRDYVGSFLREYDSAGTLTAQRVQGPVADDATYDLLGVFIENRSRLGSRVDAIAGARFNHTRVDAGKVGTPGAPGSFTIRTDTSSVAANGRLLFAVDPARHWKLFTGAAQGIRAPNLSDLTRFDIAEAGQIETPVSQLDPERFVTAETGVRAELGRATFELAYYHTWIEDLIVRTPTGLLVSGLAEVTKRNSGEGYIHGIELEAHANLTSSVSARGVLSWMEGNLKSYPTAAPVLVQEPVSRLMPATFFGSLRWQRGPWWAEANTTLAERADRLSTQDRVDVERIPASGTPGYAVFGLRAGWRAQGYLVTLALENLTDRDYRIHGSGLNEPGRNFVLNISRTW